MNKNELAKKINHKADLIRTISVDHKLELAEGQIYDNRGQAESWQDDSAEESFDNEIGGNYKYVFYCKNVDCHKVDYDNEKECEILDAFSKEGECLVSSDTKMRITDAGTDWDFEEIGYYPVELEIIK